MLVYVLIGAMIGIGIGITLFNLIGNDND